MSSSRGGRGGGGRNKDRESLPRSVQISKKLSWLLRHGAESENLPLGPGGFANLADVLNNRKLRGLQISFDEVREVVAENEKQRFTMVPVSSSADGGEGAEGEGAEGGGAKQPDLPSVDPKDWKIRANQGHSMKIEEEGLLTPITLDNGADIPETAVHGTTHGAWAAIVASGGLRPMGRNHVHFASGLPAGFKTVTSENGEVPQVDAPVISGMRSSSTVLVFVDVRKALEAGMKFWRSDNGVILTEGGGEGVVGIQFFKRVEDRTGEGLLVEDGKVVKEAPEHWARSGGGDGRGRGRGRGRGKGRGKG